MSAAVTPQPSIETVLQSEVAALAHRHVTFSWGVIGVLILVLGLASFGGWLGLRAFETQIARADAQQAQYQASLKEFQATLSQHDAQRAAAEAQVADLQAQIAHRASQPLPAPVQAGLKPDATAEQAAEAFASVYSVSPSPSTTPEGNVALSVSNTQLAISAELDKQRFQADFSDEKAIVDLQTGSISSLNKDLAQCTTLETQSEKVIADYKKLAHRSKWQKFVQGAEKAGILVLGGIIGHAL
jgi:hypothetical protein